MAIACVRWAPACPARAATADPGAAQRPLRATRAILLPAAPGPRSGCNHALARMSPAPIARSQKLAAKLLFHSIAPPALFHGILGRVLLQLAQDRIAQVDSQRVAERQQVAGYVGHLLGDFPQLHRVVHHLPRRFVLDPEKVLRQLRRLDRDSHNQVLRAVELLPLALADEATHGVLQSCQTRRGVRHDAISFGVAAAGRGLSWYT